MSIVTRFPHAAFEAASALMPTAPLVDPLGRGITYVRVSVTDRCDMRCVYCMSEDMNFLPKRDLLSLEELDRLCTAFVGRGVRKLRITGGEPLVRRNIMQLFRALGRLIETGALSELTLTTNGSQLAHHATALADAGVRRINVSLDTLDPAKYRAITRWGDHAQTMAGIDAAQAAGLSVKTQDTKRSWLGFRKSVGQFDSVGVLLVAIVLFLEDFFQPCCLLCCDPLV